MSAERPYSDRPADSDAQIWRVLALSGIAFAVLFVVGFLLSGGDTPDYSAPDQEWTKWAGDNDSNNRISIILSLLAGVAFLLFAGIIRSVLGAAEAAARSSFAPLARAAFAGGLVGISGIVMAIVMIGAASFHGSDSNPAISRAVVDAAAGPFLLASVGFAVLLAAAGLLTLRTRVFARWTGIVALIGALGFLVTFLTVTDPNSDNVFGIGFPVGFLSLAIWSIATSVATFRASGPTVRSNATSASSA